MSEKLICITCPIGCMMDVDFENNEIKNISGNMCKRGEVYALKELTNPTRVVTTTVTITNRNEMLPVKTLEDIPKPQIFELLKTLKTVEVVAPIKIGEVVYEDLENKIVIVATKSVG